MKAIVTEAAFLKRVNRALAKHQQALKKNVGGVLMRTHGTWLHIDLANGALLGGLDDLEVFARSLGVLKAWERMAL